MAEKPSIFQDGRDMVLSLAAVGVVMVASVAFTGLCSFNPDTPEQGPVQAVDDKTTLELESRSLNFPIRYVAPPDGWIPNSVRRSSIAGFPAPVVGWVTAQQGYIQLTQTGVDLPTATERFDGNLREPEASRTIGGREVRILRAKDDDIDDLWAVDLGDVRLLFSGRASDDEFRQIITQAFASAPFPATVG
ncbi:DUF4245 domain-containing protein [Corynebacterium poyangense]|nr:DUF4245 domain-containing protein [Corynebacterium poyangense]